MPQPGPSPSSRLSPALADLVLAPERVTYARLWRALDASDRIAAILAAIQSNSDGSVRAMFNIMVAEHRKYRRESVARWPVEQLAERAARLPRLSPSVIDGLLEELHGMEGRQLMSDFGDALGIDHGDSPVALDDLEVAVTGERVRDAAAHLFDRYPPDHVVTFLLHLALLEYDIANETQEWMRDRFAETSATVHVREQEDLESAESAEDAAALSPAVEETDQFTTLDRQLVRTIVDVAQGIEGALSKERLDDFIDELIQLNSDRHRSYFHAGFRDAVFRREEESEFTARNETRLRWYWAGYLTGLARAERWDEIVECFDKHPIVKGLGNDGEGPSFAAAPLIFDALCKQGREGEAARFLRPESIANSPGALIGRVYRESIRLLGTEQAPEARPLLELLSRALQQLEEEVPEPFGLEIERRRAQCYRQMGATHRAAELLEDLLDRNPGPELRAMILTDLGLIESGFRRLSEAQLPGKRDKLTAFEEALVRGEPRFRESASLEVPQAAHGRYCLGVLALARADYEEAVDHFDDSVSVFEGDPDRYEKGRLLSSARLYLGLSVCGALQEHRFQNAADRISKAIRSGASVPPYMIDEVLGVLDGHEDLAREIAETILEAAGQEMLNAVAALPGAHLSPKIASALLDRARDARRGITERCADYRLLVPLVQAQRRREELAEALDFLETAAHQGVGRDAFLEILDDPVHYDIAWTVEEALWSRVGLLETSGRYREAATLLEQEFHRALRGGSADGLSEAWAICERIDGYGLDPQRTVHLRNRLDALERQTPDDPEPGASVPRHNVSILFVGGDERQQGVAGQLRVELARSHPHVKLDFEHPGWSGHWGDKLERLKRRLDNYQGVVIMRFMRTEYGRQLRKSLNGIPWRSCAGAGTDTMRRSILEVERAAQQYVEQRIQLPE